MVVIGITGGIGVGKSTVAKMVEELGAVSIDADRVAHDVMQPRKLAWRQILEQFGRDLINNEQDVRINRNKLAARVFAEPQAREALEAIIHPRVSRHIKDRVHRLKRNRRVRMVVLDVPLLFETGSQQFVDEVVVVTAEPTVVRTRLQKRGLSEHEAAQRQAAQWDVSAKVALADRVIDNSGTSEQTRRQVKELWDQLVRTRRKRRA